MMLRTKFIFSRFTKRIPKKMDYSNCIKLDNKSLAKVFFNSQVQFYMRNLTAVDYDKIFRARKLGEKLSPPTYEFLTTEHLKERMNNVAADAEQFLQLPPIIDVCRDEVKMLSNDASLDGHDEHHSKILVIDTSFDIENFDRIVVVREPNGILRTATRDEKHRMTQIFFPMEGREVDTPKMFQQEHLNKVLDRGDYEFILDRACLQFEPDDELFHNTLISTFERINERKEFEKLNSTRHFGNLAFYLVVCKKIDHLLVYFLEKGKLMEASYLVRLYHVVLEEDAPSDANAEDVSPIDGAYKVVKDFVSLKTNETGELKAALEACMEIVRNRQQTEKTINEAHGV